MADQKLQFHDYVFQHFGSLRDNFRDAVPRTTRLPGLSGGFDQFGSQAAPSEIGRVDMTCTVVAESRDDMQAKLDALGKLNYYGKRKLYHTPQGSNTIRWTWARVNSISIPRQIDQHTDLFQTVPITYQCPDPHWYETNNEAWAIGDRVALADPGLDIGGTATPVTVTGSDSWTINHAGNAITLVRFKLVVPTGKSASDPIIQRVNGAIVDELTYTGDLVAGDALIINSRAKSITLNGADAYSSSFDFLHPDWFRLEPGDNTIEVELANVTDEIDVYAYFYNAYTT